MRLKTKGKRRLPIKANDLFTLVVAVDARHLEQLKLVWPTWCRHKPSLLSYPMLVIFDHAQCTEAEVRAILANHSRVHYFGWPLYADDFTRFASSGHKARWTDPQRYKMLAAFVHVPSQVVGTPYWLKLDTDVVATGNDDWIDKSWFAEHPAIVSHRWGYTKPADQMLELDRWVTEHSRKMGFLNQKPPLNIRPDPEGDKASHRRIISWCAFFNTEFTQWVARLCTLTCGSHHLPVPSQDGVHFYLAKRAEMAIVTPHMKRLGWQQWHSMDNIRKYAEEALR